MAEVNCFLQEHDEPACNVNSHEDDEDAPPTTHPEVSLLHMLSRDSHVVRLIFVNVKNDIPMASFSTTIIGMSVKCRMNGFANEEKA